MERKLRASDPRIEHDHLITNLRTILEAEEPVLLEALTRALGKPVPCEVDRKLRVHDHLITNLRTILEADEPALLHALTRALGTCLPPC